MAKREDAPFFFRLTLLMNTNVKILFLDILTDNKKLRQRIETAAYGGSTYAEQMRKAFGVKRVNLVAIDGSRRTLPKPSEYDAIVIGGSLEDPVKGREKPWMKKVYRFIRLAVRQHVPLLGICGGLQFTVRALGGVVMDNPKGREFGSVSITLTAGGRNDPLFSGMPRKFTAQSSHRCMAETLPKGAKILASSPLCGIQAVAVGDRVRLVQFHPEMTAAQLKAIARLRKEALIKEGFVKDERAFARFLASIKTTERVGKKILRNFMIYYALAQPAKRNRKLKRT